MNNPEDFKIEHFSLNSLSKEFEEFFDKVAGGRKEEIPDNQKETMRVCFFAGALCSINNMQALGELIQKHPLGEHIATIVITSYKDEIAKLSKKLEKKAAGNN